MFLPRVWKKRVMGSIRSLSLALSPFPLPPAWLTLHQLARPWNLEGSADEDAGRERKPDSHSEGTKTQSVDGVEEVENNRNTEEEVKDPLVKTE